MARQGSLQNWEYLGTAYAVECERGATLRGVDQILGLRDWQGS